MSIRPFVDVFASVVDDDALGVLGHPLSVRIVENVVLGILEELDRRDLVSRAIGVVKDEGEVGVALGIRTAFDGIRHILGKLEIQLVVSQPTIFVVDLEPVVVQSIVDNIIVIVIFDLHADIELIVGVACHEVAFKDIVRVSHGIIE